MDERPAEETPQVEPTSTGTETIRPKPPRSSSLVRSLILLAAGICALGWAYKLARDGMRPSLAWAKMLRSGDVDDRQIAARQLGDSDPKDFDIAVPSLLVAIKDEDEKVRAAAAAGLGSIGQTSLGAKPPRAEAKDVARALVVALADDEPEVRMSAAAAFGLFASRKGVDFPAEPSKVASAAVGLLTDPSIMVRKTGERALIQVASLGPIEPPAALLEGLKAWPLKESRAAAAIVLGAFQANQGPTVAALIASLKDKEPEVRSDSAVALEKFGIEAAPTIPSLVAVLTDSFVPPPPPPPRFPGIVGASAGGPAEGPNGELPTDPAVQAARAIGLIVKAQGEKGVAPPDEVVSALSKALHSDRPALKDAASEALQKIGKGASAAVPGLIRDLADSTPGAALGFGSIAASVLGDVAPGTDQAGPAIDALTSALEAKEPRTRKTAVEALGKFGPLASAALPRLKGLAEGADDDLARSLKSATDSIEGKAPAETGRRRGGRGRGRGGPARP